jgi:hypothetical protein
LTGAARKLNFLHRFGRRIQQRADPSAQIGQAFAPESIWCGKMSSGIPGTPATGGHGSVVDLPVKFIGGRRFNGRSFGGVSHRLPAHEAKTGTARRRCYHLPIQTGRVMQSSVEAKR